MSNKNKVKLPADVADKFEVEGDCGPVVNYRGTIDLRTISVDTAAALVKQGFPHLKEKAAPPAAKQTKAAKEKADEKAPADKQAE
jgi:hypothetical protein